MTKTTKTFLALGIACVVPGVVLNAGLVDVTNVEGLYALLPAGVIFLAMFVILKLLEKETVAYDRERQAAQAVAVEATREGQPPAKAGKAGFVLPSLSTAVEDMTSDVEEHELQHR